MCRPSVAAVRRTHGPPSFGSRLARSADVLIAQVSFTIPWHPPSATQQLRSTRQSASVVQHLRLVPISWHQHAESPPQRLTPHLIGGLGVEANAPAVTISASSRNSLMIFLRPLQPAVRVRPKRVRAEHLHSYRHRKTTVLRPMSARVCMLPTRARKAQRRRLQRE